MNAFEESRQRLIDALNEEHNPSYWGGEPRDAERLVDDFTHALAEKIRAWDGPDSIAERWADGLSDAADFIDPKARTGEVRGCAT